MSSFTHIDDKGRVRMVDVTDKQPTARVAVAGGAVIMKPETFKLIGDQKVKKGNVLETARIAGIMAAKKTSELIPMCHPLNLTHVQIDFNPDETKQCIGIEASVRTIDQTGVRTRAMERKLKEVEELPIDESTRILDLDSFADIDEVK